MPESHFIQEVRHRATLLTASFNPGRAIIWARKTDNRRRILCLQEDTRKYLSGDSTPQEVSAFWSRLDASPEIKAFISCLDAGARELRGRGRKGDIYSVPVIHYVVTHFIQHYLRGIPEITPESEG
ncbi:hypothetical protein OZ248_004368 [Salmonella enterica]|uniref:hypothetical protein n=1 Tax=Salmonella enterica TaxID=28901 RepID=UPI0029C4C5EA|nr:hypothetical protein [Salmonella enterica]EJI6167158.1 hypothetical protein [Salmonella enterica]EJJ7005106.1 hypothetical protein [Salmonella enterica]EJT0678375.1 hypothetical protein [Salmonella enterica]EKF6307718.1 hypothetical protein [Salmonella enterica]